MNNLTIINEAVNAEIAKEPPMFELAQLANSLSNMGKSIATFLSYRNPDRRCTYPWDPSPCGYCWSFAHHVDGTKGYEDMLTICPGCDLWEPRGREFGNPERLTGTKPEVSG